MIRTSRFALLLGAFALCAPVCTAGTKMLQSEKSPAAGAGPMEFKKVLALVVSDDVQARRTAEDELVKQMKAREGVRASDILTVEDRKDKEKAKEKIKASGCDGVVVMRLADRSREKRSAWTLSVNVIVYSTFWGYYDALWAGPVLVTPAYTNTDIYFVFETRVFSLKDDQLIWAAATQTKNPDSLREMVGEVVKAVGKQIRKDGVIP